MARTFRTALVLAAIAACLSAQSKFPTTTTLSTTAPGTVPAAQQVTLRAVVTDSTGVLLPTSGAVQFIDNGANLGPAVAAPAGSAVTSVTLTAGIHNIKALFSGDAGLTASQSALLQQTVTANACPQLAFAQTPASAAAGTGFGPVTVRVACGAGVSTITLVAQGLGSFKGAVSAPVVNGSATFTNLVLATPGTYSLAASAPGAAGAVSNLFVVAPPGPASIFTVTNTSDSGTGSFRDAFNQANVRGGIVTFQDGMSGTIALASPLPQLIVDVQVIGPGPRVLTLSGASQTRVLFIQSGTVSISGLTISDGTGANTVLESLGAGIQNLSSSQVSIDNCIVTNNSSPVAGATGGGIYNTGKLSVTNSTISYNKAGSGAGIENTGNLTIGNSVLLGNVSTSTTGGGAAILNDPGASLTVSKTSFTGNTAAESAGAILNLGTATIADSVFSHNEAHGSNAAGAALLNQTGATASIVRSTFASNFSTHDGGAIANQTNSTVTLVNSTLTNNSANGDGGALVNSATASGSLTDCTVYGNSGQLGAGIYNEGNGSQLTVANSILAANLNGLSGVEDDCTNCGSVATGNLVGGNPLLGNLQDNGGPAPTMLPLPGSPAIGAGSAVAGVPTDQRGQPRPTSGAVDVGAVQTSYGLAFSTQPQTTVQGAPISAGVQLQETGRPFAPAANAAVGSATPLPFTATMALASGTGVLSGGSANVDPASGIASFTGMQVSALGTKTLKATVPGFASATSQPFSITAVVIVPASIVPTAGNGQSAAVNSDFATPLQVSVRDASGAGLAGLSVIFTAVAGAAFGGGSPTTVAITDAGGLATATTLTAGPTPGSATVSVGIPGYSLQATFTLTVVLNPAAPSITAAGFLNDASFVATGAAPNTIMAAFGTFPCGNAVVLLVNGKPAEILSASGGQVNFTMPATVIGSSSASVQAACGTLVSGSIQLPVAIAAPGIFTITQTGKGQAAAINQNGVLNNALSPAAAGQIVSLYVTGLGPYNAAGADGLQHMALPIQAFLGGAQATVQYAGNAPGYTFGLQQVNIVVPQGVSGLATALTLSAGGVNSQPGVTLAIQ